MGGPTPQPWARAAWELAGRQHGVLTRSQLLGLGMGSRSIEHRLKSGRLHRVLRGVYAVGRPDLTERGRWMAAVLACGPDALLSHQSAAALWRIRGSGPGVVDVVVQADKPRDRPGIRAHRRRDHEAPGRRAVGRIPVTHPVATLIDLAACLPQGQVEAAINEADHRDLIDPEQLRRSLDPLRGRAGIARLRRLLDGPTIALTSSELERRFLPLAFAAGLPAPQTQTNLGHHRVDFIWPELGLVVETDSLRYHRTAFKQAEDKRRDNAHVAFGLATLRFTHMQVCHEPAYVRTTLTRTLRQLRPTLKG
jgi:predicted transcriptional regulator of viral defense system